MNAQADMRSCCSLLFKRPFSCPCHTQKRKFSAYKAAAYLHVITIYIHNKFDTSSFEKNIFSVCRSFVRLVKFIFGSLYTELTTTENLFRYGKTCFLRLYIYILGVLTEKPYSSASERNVIYIPLTTSSHVKI